MSWIDAIFYFFLALYSGSSIVDWLVKVPKRDIKQRDAIALVVNLTAFVASLVVFILIMFGVPTPNA